MASLKNFLFGFFVMSLFLNCLSSCKTTNYAFKQLDFTKESPDGNIRHRPMPRSTFSYPDDERVVLFCALFNQERTYKITAIWTTPENTIFSRQQKTQTQNHARSEYEWFYTKFELPTKEISTYPGKWKVEILIDGELARTKYFTLISKMAELEGVKARPVGSPVQRETASSPAQFQEISALGLTVKDLSFALANFGTAPNERGVGVFAVANESPAYKAGLRYGDVIKEVNQQVVNNLDEYSRALSNARNDEALILKLRRGNVTQLVSIRAPWTNSQETAKTCYQKGNEQFEAKNYRYAIYYYQKAIELEENFAPLYYNLAMAQIAEGINKEAINNLKRYLQIRPDGANASEVKQLIRSLSK
jgi:tetratricopeptide (TPR) repeat protein